MTNSIPLLNQNKPLSEVDPELFQLIEGERKRQWIGLELIASEVCCTLDYLTCRTLPVALSWIVSEAFSQTNTVRDKLVKDTMVETNTSIK
jgi:hypothetical protein